MRCDGEIARHDEARSKAERNVVRRTRNAFAHIRPKLIFVFINRKGNDKKRMAVKNAVE